MNSELKSIPNRVLSPISITTHKENEPSIIIFIRHLFFSMDAARMVPIGIDIIGDNKAMPYTSYLRMILTSNRDDVLNLNGFGLLGKYLFFSFNINCQR